MQTLTIFLSPRNSATLKHWVHVLGLCSLGLTAVSYHKDQCEGQSCFHLHDGLLTQIDPLEKDFWEC